MTPDCIVTFLVSVCDDKYELLPPAGVESYCFSSDLIVLYSTPLGQSDIIAIITSLISSLIM